MLRFTSPSNGMRSSGCETKKQAAPSTKHSKYWTKERPRFIFGESGTVFPTFLYTKKRRPQLWLPAAPQKRDADTSTDQRKKRLVSLVNPGDTQQGGGMLRRKAGHFYLL